MSSLQFAEVESHLGGRPQLRRAWELFHQRGLTEAHLTAMRAVGITDVGKAQVTQSGYGKNTPKMQRLAAEAKAALGGYYRELVSVPRETTGWRAGCACADAGDPIPCTVLDPFCGSGTVSLVARKHGRHSWGIDLSAAYLEMARERLGQLALPLAGG